VAIASTLRFQDYQFQVTLNSGAWRWTTRVDVSQAVASTYIRDIVSPYGILRDSIPLPGEVVQAMADSIAQVQQSYTPRILLGSTAITLTVDQGRGISAPVPVAITNNGILGSLLSATVTSSAGYVSATPASLGGLLANESGTFEVSVDSANLLATSSPYVSTLTIQSTEATNSPQAIVVNVVVRPKATIGFLPVLPATNLLFEGELQLDGSYPALPLQTFEVKNTGPIDSELSFQIRSLGGAPWLAAVSPVNGTLAGGSSVSISVQVSPSGMLPGTYTETLRVSGYSTNSYLDLTITLDLI